MDGDDRGVRAWVVRGRVQGVGFRWSTCREAEGLGLAGWVRNEADGSVRVEAHGAGEAIDALEKWLHRGPTGARVTEVTRVEPRRPATEAEGADGMGRGFEIRR